MLLRDGLQIIQGVVRQGADTTRSTPATTRNASPEREAVPLTNGDVAPHPTVSALKAESTTVTSTGSSTPAQISKRPGIIGQKTQAELGNITKDAGVSENMVRFAERLPLETLVLIEGRVQSPQEDSGGEQNFVRSGNVHGAEIEVYRVCISLC